MRHFVPVTLCAGVRGTICPGFRSGRLLQTILSRLVCQRKHLISPLLSGGALSNVAHGTDCNPFPAGSVVHVSCNRPTLTLQGDYYNLVNHFFLTSWTLCRPITHKYKYIPLSSYITPSVFHSRLKTYLFNKSPP